MKKKVRVVLVAMSFAMAMIVSSKEARAVCQEFFGGGGHVCCFYGEGTDCVNGVTDEYDGPYYYYAIGEED